VRKRNFIKIWDRAGLAVIVLSSWVVFAIFTQGFTSQFNIFSVGRLVSILIVVGLSQTVVMGIGDINLSVGAIGGVVAMFFGWMVAPTQLGTSGLASGAPVDVTALPGLGIPWQLAFILAILFGAFLGFINGWLIVKSGLSGFIVTLGTLGVFSGSMYIITKVKAFRDLPQSFLDFGKMKFFNLFSPLVIIMVVVVIVLFFFYRGTTPGRQMLATGANRRAARASGIQVNRIVISTHMLSAALAGLAGLMLVARIGAAIPTIGTGGGGDWLLPSFAASAIGGTLFTGGWVNVLGTFFGGLLLGTIENGLVLLNVPSFWVQMITGLVLLIAVILDRVRVVAVERSRMGAAQ
jgi:ribose transport system permease protein